VIDTTKQMPAAQVAEQALAAAQAAKDEPRSSTFARKNVKEINDGTHHVRGQSPQGAFYLSHGL